VEYDQLRMDIELVPSKLYTMAKPLSKRGERFLRDRYIAHTEGHVLLRPSGAFVVPRMVWGFALARHCSRKKRGRRWASPKLT